MDQPFPITDVSLLTDFDCRFVLGRLVHSGEISLQQLNRLYLESWSKRAEIDRYLEAAVGPRGRRRPPELSEEARELRQQQGRFAGYIRRLAKKNPDAARIFLQAADDPGFEKVPVLDKVKMLEKVNTIAEAYLKRWDEKEQRSFLELVRAHGKRHLDRVYEVLGDQKRMEAIRRNSAINWDE